MNLFDDDLFDRFGVRAQDGDTRDLRIASCDAWSQISTQAMAQQENLFWIYFGLLGDQGDRRTRIADHFVIDRQLSGVVGALVSVFFGALGVTKDGHAFAGEAEGQILEPFVRSDAFVLVVRA